MGLPCDPYLDWELDKNRRIQRRAPCVFGCPGKQDAAGHRILERRVLRRLARHARHREAPGADLVAARASRLPGRICTASCHGYQIFFPVATIICGELRKRNETNTNKLSRLPDL